VTAPQQPSPQQPKSVWRAYGLYLGLRMGLFALALVVCILLGLRGLIAVVLALLVSGVLAFPLARKQRDEVVRSFRERRR
jgi:uncharacterized protein YacL